MNTAKNPPILSKEELKALKKALPKGYFAQLAEKTQLSERTIANFFAGSSYKEEVHAAAIELAAQYKERIAALREWQKQVTK